MSWKHCGPGRRGYHHGNLREALIESALSLIGEKGPAGFTIAEAARSAGVSPAAPYRHFRDREELMAEVARLGFERFANDLEKAWHGGQPISARGAAECGARLSRLRPQRACLLCSHVRNRPAESLKCRASGVCRPGARRALRSHKEARRETSRGQSAALPDGCAAHLGDVARYRFALRTREMRKRDRRSRRKSF